jgi:hypothetical protein
MQKKVESTPNLPPQNGLKENIEFISTGVPCFRLPDSICDGYVNTISEDPNNPLTLEELQYCTKNLTEMIFAIPEGFEIFSEDFRWLIPSVAMYTNPKEFARNVLRQESFDFDSNAVFAETKRDIMNPSSTVPESGLQLSGELVDTPIISGDDITDLKTRVILLTRLIRRGIANSEGMTEFITIAGVVRIKIFKPEGITIPAFELKKIVN